RSGGRGGIARGPPRRRRTGCIRAGAAAGRLPARRVPEPVADAAHRRRHARIESTRVVPRCRKGRGGARWPLTMPTLTYSELRDLASRALVRAGASAATARITARALADAEAQGLSSHG